MVTTGRLHAEGCAAALEALARFRMIADGLHVESREAVATAAADSTWPASTCSCRSWPPPGRSGQRATAGGGPTW